MPKVIDNYINEIVAEEIYESIVDRFDLAGYKSTCCYDSEMDRAQAFDYLKEADFLFAHYLDLEEKGHHFYINSFQAGSRILGLHNSNNESRAWDKHLTLLLGGSESKGGDYYFLSDESGVVFDHPAKEDFQQVEFKNNRLIESDPEERRLMSYIERGQGPALHINLLYHDE
jgi:hypothetical protein